MLMKNFIKILNTRYRHPEVLLAVTFFLNYFLIGTVYYYFTRDILKLHTYLTR